MNFADRLHAATKELGNACLIGIDPHLDMLPEQYAAARNVELPRHVRAAAMGDFCVELVDLVAGRVPVVKPQSAFFEVFGADGHIQWERVVSHAKSAGLLVVGDVKRGDIASTAAAYARGLLAGCGAAHEDAHLCDAVTVNAFLGEESITPFLNVCRETNTGIYVLVRTSNPGSADFQLCGDPTLSERIADAVNRWGKDLMGESGYSSVGAVVGATHPEALAAMRERMPHTPLLLPGYGAQGAGAEDIAAGFHKGGFGAIVNSSRGISFAYKKAGRPCSEWREAAVDALDSMIQEIGAVAHAAV
ncbi:MAG: orotidine-5'-phosphate decarboxylase [Planctomycetota bacterium]|nr:orotidine-5'-phosphate decarboxylase [Planctomycetota bacterium]MDG2142282.1 orotidine-5'-phosphate decarboxylase [Planctomycetota bacterium]